MVDDSYAVDTCVSNEVVMLQSFTTALFVVACACRSGASTLCAVAKEQGTVTVGCDGTDTISTIDFCEFGVISGTCPTLAVDPSCTAPEFAAYANTYEL